MNDMPAIFHSPIQGPEAGSQSESVLGFRMVVTVEWVDREEKTMEKICTAQLHTLS